MTCHNTTFPELSEVGKEAFLLKSPQILGLIPQPQYRKFKFLMCANPQFTIFKFV
jgi:hypothetical protein